MGYILQSGIELPYRAINSKIADSLNVLIQQERRPGERFVSEMIEIRGYNSEVDRYDLSPILTGSPQASAGNNFAFEVDGVVPTKGARHRSSAWH